MGLPLRWIVSQPFITGAAASTSLSSRDELRL